MGLGLRGLREGAPLVVGVGVEKELAARLFGERCVVVTAKAEELPLCGAGYLPADAVLVGDDGSALPAEARVGLMDWVRGGGVIVFVLDAEAPVRGEGLAAELGECAGRATGLEWLAAVADRQRTTRLGGSMGWRVGLGWAAAGAREGAASGALAPLLRAAAREDVWVDEGVYRAFRGPSWGARMRWRLVVGAGALLAGGLMVAWALSRRLGRGVGALSVGAVSAVLAWVAWVGILPSGRCVLEVASLVEGAAGEQGGRRTEVACVGALGRGGVELDFGAAEAVVPLYQAAEEAGGWRGTVVARDASGRWTVECRLGRDERRCFAGWWRWGSAAEGGGEEVRVRDGRLVRELSGWGERERRLVEWQARRGSGGLYRVRRQEDARWMVNGRGMMEVWRGPALVWTEVADAK